MSVSSNCPPRRCASAPLTAARMSLARALESLLVACALGVCALFFAGCKNDSGSSGPVSPRIAVPLADGSGLLDPTFADDGVFLTPESTAGAPILTDGLGYVLSTGRGAEGMIVLRLDADGRPDLSFADDGVFLDPDSSTDSGKQGRALALDRFGRIVVIGSSVGDSGTVILIWRLLDDGSLDSTFGEQGIARIPQDEHPQLAAAVLDEFDRILVVGSIVQDSSPHMFVSRFSADGVQDSGFGSEGLVLDSEVGKGRAIALGPLGEIVITGERGERLAVWRFDSRGDVDPFFGDGGVVTRAHSWTTGSLSGRAVLVDSDSMILVAGDLINPPPKDPPFSICIPIYGPCPPRPPPVPLDPVTTAQDVMVWRFDDAGNLDPFFGSGGVVTLTTRALAGEENADRARSLAIDEDMNIVIVGETLEDLHISNIIPTLTWRSHTMTVYRLQPDGGLDLEFNGTGFGSFPLGQRSRACSVTVDTRNQVLIAGRAKDADGDQLAIWRLE